LPYAILAIGLVLVASAYQGTTAALGRELREDFTGPGNFFFWIASIMAVGAVGYYAPARPAAKAFLVLILLAMVLSNRGVFAQVQSALESGPASPQKNKSPAIGDDKNYEGTPAPADTGIRGTIIEKSETSPMDNAKTAFKVGKMLLGFM
jgi:hypothetical protein